MSDKLDFVFTPQINKDEIRVKCEVLHGSSKLFEEYVEAKESMVRELSAKLLEPKDLIKNPHVKKLVKALEFYTDKELFEQGHGLDFHETAKEALAEWEGE